MEFFEQYFAVLFWVWIISAVVAGVIASNRERSFPGFFIVTLIFLGPLGPGFALVAMHGRIERVQLADIAARAAYPYANPPSPIAAPKAPKLETQQISCFKCGHKQKVLSNERTFTCGQCGTKLSRKKA